MIHTRLTYAGIGSRETPGSIMKLMGRIANRLDGQGYTLRSGHAPGADQAFEFGAYSAEIFLPWATFENGVPFPQDAVIYDKPSDAAYEMAEDFHPAWARCSPAARKFHARNCHQVLGYTLDSPVEFVICWTPRGQMSGGTAQALRIAQHHEIPIYNLGNKEVLDRIIALYSL